MEWESITRCTSITNTINAPLVLQAPQALQTTNLSTSQNGNANKLKSKRYKGYKFKFIDEKSFCNSENDEEKDALVAILYLYFRFRKSKIR